MHHHHSRDFAKTEEGYGFPSQHLDDQPADLANDAEALVRKEYGPDLIPPSTAHTVPSTPLQPGTPRALDPIRTIDTATARSDLVRLRHKETKLAQKDAHPWQHLGITLGLPMILLFDIVVPCIIYYTWYRARVGDWERQCAAADESPCALAAPAQFDDAILGSAIASFGIGELWILLARAYRLFFHRDVCAPLLSPSRWALDATAWVYLAAILIALVPFLVGASLEMPHLYLYGPSFLMGFLGIMMVITTLHPFRIPIALNSQPKGTPLRPFIYYAAEDFMAVDGLQDREFRTRYNDRYEANPMFRKFFFNLTLWWTLGVCVYIGAVSAVIWTLPFHYAFGLSLGVLFSYIAVWAVVTFVWVKIEMKREHEAYERGDFDV